ncbi:protein eva-1 homolog A [Neosynchiropus ocellatus]
MSTTTTGSPNMEVTVVTQEMALLSNILAAYTFIVDQPERTTLVFVSGVCAGLLVTLCAIVFQIHCRADCHFGNSSNPHHLHRLHHPHHHHHHHHHRHRNKPYRHRVGCPLHQPLDNNPDSMAVVSAEPQTRDPEPDDWDETYDLSSRRRQRFERALLRAGLYTSAEELDRAQRLEERERVLREIWMNGQPDISTVTQSLNRYY